MGWLRCCPRSSPGNGDLGRAGCSLRARDPNLEHPVAVGGLDIVGHSTLGKCDVTLEFAIPEFGAVTPLALVLGLLLPMGADLDETITRVYLTVLRGVDVGQLCPHDERVTVVELFHPQPRLVAVKVEQAPPRDRGPFDMRVTMNKSHNSSVAFVGLNAFDTIVRCRTPMR